MVIAFAVVVVIVQIAIRLPERGPGSVVLTALPSVTTAPRPANTPTQEQECTTATAEWAAKPGFALTLAPAVPAAGQSVRVTGVGLDAGVYEVTVRPARGSGVVPLGTTTVAGGTMDFTFTQPSMPGLCVVVAASSAAGDYLSKPFVMAEARP